MNKFVWTLPLTLSLLACLEKDERLEGQEPGDCTDMADNDMDGKFDCEDDGCANSPECSDSSSEEPEDTGVDPVEDTGDVSDTDDTQDTEETDTEDTDTEDTDTEDTDVAGTQDTDGDGLTDEEEVTGGTDPTSSDTDGDGLSDGDEVNTHGTDPLNVDTDGDGLFDKEELTVHGTNPLSVDTDGDVYTDFDEINQFETDPLDASSGGYVGGWPYQPNKDSYNAPTSPSSTSANVGALLLRDELMDQHGDMVDLYDFAGQGKYIVLVITAMWSGPDQMLAEAIAFNNNTSWGTAPQKVADGDIYWINIMDVNISGNQASLTDLQDWYANYPNPLVPVLADNISSDFAGLYFDTGWPTILVFDENMQFVTGPTSTDYWAALSFIDGL